MELTNVRDAQNACGRRSACQKEEKMIRRLTLLLSLGAAGCASVSNSTPTATPTVTTAPPVVAATVTPKVSTTALNEISRSAECVQKLETRPSFAALWAKSKDGTGFDQMVSKAKVTKHEQKLIKEYVTNLTPCRPQIVASTPSDNALKVILDSAWESQAAAMSDLYSGRITWGGFTSRSASTDGEVARQVGTLVTAN